MLSRARWAESSMERLPLVSDTRIFLTEPSRLIVKVTTVLARRPARTENLRIILANPFDEFQSADLRDLQVRNDNIDRILLKYLQRLLGGRGRPSRCRR